MPAQPLQPTVFYFARMGDMVMLTSLLQFLHRRYHRPCQVISGGSWTNAVFEDNPDVAHVWAFHRHLPFPLSLQWPRLARVLRDAAPGPIYICEHHWRQLPRIRRMLRFSGVDPNRCVFIDNEPQQGELHSIERLVALGHRTPPALREADYPNPTGVWAPRLRVLEPERATRDEWIKAQGWSGRPLILVQPGNHRSMSSKRKRWRRLNTDDKYWPIERWVQLLHKVHEEMPEALLILRGSQEEVAMLEEIRLAAGLAEVRVVALGLRPLFSLCEAAHSMISVDTGPAHSAAALGLPLVVMFGAGPQRYWLPRSASGSPVIGIGGPPESKRVDQISVDAVVNAWRQLLRRMTVAAPDNPLESSRTAGSRN